MGFSLLPREDAYFDLFSQTAEKIKLASNALVEMMEDKPETFEVYVKRIKDLEHDCDDLTHQITVKLDKSFITPFDREDIFTLSVVLDDVCDYIDESSTAILMYNINEIGDHARHFANIIQAQTTEIALSVSMLKKPNGFKKHIAEIRRLEKEADDLYFKAVGELFQKDTDSKTLIKLKALYETLEIATDRCERVGNIIESVILKHN